MSRFDAFISYSHKGDLRVGKHLQQQLWRIARPWYQRHALSVFRDDTDLNANPDLWASIVTALNSSNHLIFLASQEARNSEWVGKEISHWLKNATDARDNLLIVLTAGDIVWLDDANDFDWNKTNALPKILSAVYEYVPKWVDMRGYRSEQDLSRSNPDFLRDCARLVSVIRNKPLSYIFGEDYRQHRRAKQLAWGAGIALTVLTVLSATLGIQAISKATETELERERAVASAKGSALKRVQVLGEREPSLALQLLMNEDEFDVDSRGFAWSVLRHRYDHLIAAAQISGEVVDVTYSRLAVGDNPRLLYVKRNGDLMEWRFLNNSTVKLWHNERPFPGTTVLRSDGRYLAVTYDDIVSIYEINESNVEFLARLPNKIQKLAFVAKDDALVTFGRDGALRWWEFEDGVTLTHVFENWQAEVLGGETDEDAHAFLSLTALAVLDVDNIWSTTSFDFEGEFHTSSLDKTDLLNKTVESVSFKGAHRTINMQSMSATNEILILSSLDDRATYSLPELSVINVLTEDLRTYVDSESELLAIGGSLNSSAYVVGSERGVIRVFGPQLGEPVRNLRLSNSQQFAELSRVLIAPDVSSVAALTREGKLLVFNAHRETAVTNDGASGSKVSELSISFTGDEIAISRSGPGSEDWSELLWQPKTGVSTDDENSWQDGRKMDGVYHSSSLFDQLEWDIIGIASDDIVGLGRNRNENPRLQLGLLDGKSGQLKRLLWDEPDDDNPVTSVDLFQNAGVIGFADGKLRIWNTANDTQTGYAKRFTV